eukprot:TRINITY_DN15819_c0_g1_i1.p1 TRINITY_DN15819_c0_g1~~TRINITY_DN15819_c0_g1_i1.p1  ORF type:complete len:185 (-),score=43.28 TRINITY_DN15819_c0_g1_i1:56-610(-)
MILQSNRLLFTKWDEKDSQFLYEHYTNEKVIEHMQECRLESLKEAEEEMRGFNKDFDEMGYGMLKVIEKKSGDIIGVAGLFRIMTNEKGGRLKDNSEGIEEIEIGYDFSPKYWGNGFATECTKFWVDYIFNNERFSKHDKIVAYVDYSNIPSQKVLEKCSFDKLDSPVSYLDENTLCWKYQRFR